jgi:hypothetical protein
MNKKHRSSIQRNEYSMNHIAKKHKIFDNKLINTFSFFLFNETLEKH